MIRIFGCVSAFAAFAAATASAQALDPELTMRPMPNPRTDMPAAVTELLALPEAASGVAQERSVAGLSRANENRARAAENRGEALARAAERRATRLDMAADARELGADFGADVAEAARGVRESLVRGGGELRLPIPMSLPELPDHVPARSDVPAAPVELPDRPALPGQAGGGA